LPLCAEARAEEVRIKNADELLKARPLIQQSYEES